MLVENDGAVRAMVGGRDYGASQFNRATDALRQPGSSFKPYVYATALMNGFKPTSIVVDAPICIGNWCPQNYSGGYSGSMTLTHALMQSINIIPVKLSIALGKGNPKIGRAKIVETARKMGLRTPLPDTPSLPIGADEVTVLDHAGAFATFPNGGKAVPPHAILEVRTANGEIVWRFDRDGKKPVQVIPAQVASDMNMMLNQAAEAGTGRRSILDGIRSAGKTGTTNAYRDAWFVGYTGNFTCAVWFGNDDYAPTNRMTGGSLPAMTWKAIVSYAHQAVEQKPIPGVPPPSTTRPAPHTLVSNSAKTDEVVPPPPTLTKRGVEVLVHVERLLDEAANALEISKDANSTTGQGRRSSLDRPDAVASVGQRRPAEPVADR